MNSHALDIATGKRFKFGANWSRFLKDLTESRISSATEDVRKMLDVENLHGKSFLDVGSGSGLTSLAAFRLGASVRSFDYDPQSVECTKELHRKNAASSSKWSVTEGSALDLTFLKSLGNFDVVCSWGVLHHTGSMWNALDNMIPLVRNEGLLYIAIYNDQGSWSRRWLIIKKTYNWLPAPAAWLFAVVVMGARELRYAVASLLRFRFGTYIRSWTHYGSDESRGMSKYHDLLDWVGGYPFEVAKPEQILYFYRARGFTLERLKTCGGGLGCNQYVFRRAMS